MNTVNSRDGTAVAFERMGAGPAVTLVGGALVARADPKRTELAAALAPQCSAFSKEIDRG